MDHFVDYYELLQISPNAEFATIHRVHRMLAARYHPDNAQTADLERFIQLQQAYEILSDPERRAAYDASWHAERAQPLPVFELKEFVVGVDAEINRRLGALCLLYNRRRSNPETPGLSLLDLEAMMDLPREHLEFTVWYLRDKGFLRRSDTSDMTITSTGVDFVESNLSSSRIVHALLQPPPVVHTPWAPVTTESTNTAHDATRAGE